MQELKCTMKKWNSAKGEWFKDDDCEKSVKVNRASLMHFYEDWIV